MSETATQGNGGARPGEARAGATAGHRRRRKQVLRLLTPVTSNQAMLAEPGYIDLERQMFAWMREEIQAD